VIKFFAWLLYHGRLNTYAHLYHRNIKTLDELWWERCHGAIETDEHVFTGCSTAQGIKGCLHISIHGATFRRPWEIGMAIALQ
jgi:hypothetical protein